jgi:hypothetical protein
MLRRVRESAPDESGKMMSETETRAANTRFIQITTSVHGNGEILLYALDELGDVWRFDDKTRQWVMLSRERR